MTTDIAPLSNILGFLALGSYIVTLLPTILRIVFPKTKQTGIPNLLLKHRRSIGILAFCFALGHGFLLIQKRHFDVFDPKTYWIYMQGVATFVIFTLLAITSNDWSIKRLRKKLEAATYAHLLSHVSSNLARLGQNVRTLDLFNSSWHRGERWHNGSLSDPPMD